MIYIKTDFMNSLPCRYTFKMYYFSFAKLKISMSFSHKRFRSHLLTQWMHLHSFNYGIMCFYVLTFIK